GLRESAACSCPRLLLRRDQTRVWSDGEPDNLTRNNHFHASILLTSCSGVPAGDRLAFTKASCCDCAALDSLLNKIITDRIRAFLREFHVVFIASDIVGVTFNFQQESRMREHDTRDL